MSACDIHPIEWCKVEQRGTYSGSRIRKARFHSHKLYRDTTNQKPTRRIPSHGNSLVIALVVGARRAVVAAPPGIEVRDALAFYRILARLFALLNARQFARRVLDVLLSGARIALDLGADLQPYAEVLRSACKWQAMLGCHHVHHAC